MGAILSVEGLRRSFYGVKALQGVDFEVERGSITALVGPNGAGKSTAFQCIAGVETVDDGKVVFDGQDITRWGAARTTRQGLIKTFQIPRLIARLTLLENLMVFAPGLAGEGLTAALLARGRAREDEAYQRAVEIARMLRLDHVLHNPASALSGGQKKLVEIARCLMQSPKMILLDEPVAGVNPALAVEIADHIVLLRDKGVTFLIVEHNMELVARLCDRVIVMAEGRHLVTGSFTEIASDSFVQEAYMGRRQ